MGIDLRGAEATSVEWSSNVKKMPRVGVHYETKTKGTKTFYSRHQHEQFIDMHIIKASLSASDYIPSVQKWCLFFFLSFFPSVMIVVVVVVVVVAFRVGVRMNKVRPYLLV